MQKFLLLALLWGSSLMASAAHYSFHYGNIYYNITSSDYFTAEVTWGDDYGQYSGIVTIPEVAIHDGKEYTVTSVGANAFRQCAGLRGVVFPSTVTYIGKNAFMGCYSMIEITIPETITSIDNYAFAGCSGLSKLNIEPAKKNLSLGYGASKGEAYGLFNDCPVKEFIVKRNLDYSTKSYYGYSPFANHNTLRSITYAEGMTYTHSYLCYGNTQLTSVTLPESMLTVSACTFTGCNSLSQIDIPSEVTVIGDNAFQNCSVLSTVKIGSGVETINKYAFSGCIGLKSLTIPGNVTGIGDYAFSGCKKLSNLNIEPGLKNLSLGNGASKGEAYGLFNDCPVEEFIVKRNLDYSTKSYYGYSPFANHNTLKSITYAEGMTYTHSYLCYGNTQLTSVTLPESMLTVSACTFTGCNSLSQIDIPSEVTVIGDNAFQNCSVLSTVKIGSGVETINKYAFSGCIGLKSLTIPGNVTGIGDYAFSGCKKLSNLNIEPGLKNLSLGNGASKGEAYGLFNDCPVEEFIVKRNLDYSTKSYYGYSPFANHNTLKSITYAEGMTYTHSYLCYGNTQLTSVTLPESMLTVSACTFTGCNSLSQIDIPSEVTVIGDNAFQNCSVLSTVKIGSGVETINKYAFSGCIGLKSLTIPGNVTGIGDYAFSGCKKLSNLNIEPGLKNLSLGNGASKGEAYGLFNDCPVEEFIVKRNLDYSTKSYYGYSPFANHNTLRSITYAEGMTYTHSYLCYGNVYLTNVMLPKSMHEINSYTFAGCASLTDVYIAQGVEDINEGAFSGCNALETISVPASVTYIGSNVFANCSSLKDFYCYSAEKWNNNNTRPTVNTNTFSNTKVEDATLHVPSSAFTMYQTTEPWKYFGNMVAINGDYPSSYTVTAKVSPSEAGTVTGGGTYVEGTTIQLTATANEGYKFSRWSDGNTSNPRSMKVTNDINLTAQFVIDDIKPTFDITDITDMNNLVYINPVETSPGSDVVLSLNLKNSVAVEGFSFDLYLPDCMEFLFDEDDFPEVNLSTQRTTSRKTNTFEAAIQPDGALRVFAASTNGSTINGNDGEVVTVKIHVGGTATPAYYPLILTNIAVSDSDAHSYNTASVVCSIKVGMSLTCDVNQDSAVDISDVVAVINTMAGDNKFRATADVNGDGSIDISDVVAIINYMAGDK